MVPLVSTKWCEAHQVAILAETPPYRVAVLDDSDELLLEKMKMELGDSVWPETRPLPEIRHLLNRNLDDSIPLEQEIGNDTASWESAPIVNLVDTLLDEALERGASDIHLEPGSGNFRVRFREDGLLVDYKALPSWAGEPVLVRLKILAEIDITDKRVPHDGSFAYRGFRRGANIRVSTLPVQGGEKCVLRLLPLSETDSGNGGLDSLQLGADTLKFLRQVFRSPQGIFLVTGPTGSGKTTTLHAGLREILQRQINVTTIEDPVEYPLAGAAQVQVNEKCGFTFAVALRALLRQDPDVILVGEIRDLETAQIALRAAQTGHLVLSTLHTNSARAAFTRLKDLGIPRNLFQESLLGIMAQRLVRCRPGPGLPYSGRMAVTEILKPDGSFVDGTLQENARQLVQHGVTDKAEVERVMGK